MRICLDPQDLNNFLKKEQYLISTIEDITFKLQNAKYFSVLDLKDGFWHIELEGNSRKYCTFNTPFGIYQFIRMPFGISTAPEIFQKRNEENFADLPGVVIYIDDIMIR